MNIFTCAKLKLDDSAEFQIVPTISNPISILYNSVVLKLRWLWLHAIELQICKIIHKNLVDGFSRFQRFVEPAEQTILGRRLSAHVNARL
jgi:hypothetical protein